MTSRNLLCKQTCLGLFATFILAGCVSSNRSPDAGMPKPGFLHAQTQLGAELSSSSLVYLRDHHKIHLGEDTQKVLGYFSKPSKATSANTLPSSLGPPLVATGWSSKEEGLGVISENDKVVFILHTFNHFNEQTVKEVYGRYQKQFGPPQELLGKYSSYWFWHAGNQRLMISSSLDNKGNWAVTVALGIVSIMDALRMNLDDAKADQAKAATLLAK